MISRLIRWLARAELERAQTEALRQRIEGYNAGLMTGRIIGQGEMLAHLRGDPGLPVTSDIIAQTARAMVH